MASYQPSTPAQSAPHSGRVSLPVGDRRVEDILMWRDWRYSSAYLTGITVVYLVLEWSNLSLLRIVAHSLLAVVAITFLWNNIASFTNKQGMPIPSVIRQGISEAQIRDFAQRAVTPTNRILGFVKRVISGHEVVLSVQVAAGLYVFGRLANFFTSLGLLYIVVLLAFSIPKAYEANKKEVDQVVNSVQKQTRSYYKQYAEPYVQKIPRASTSTAKSGSVTAGGNSNGDIADSYTHVPKTNLQDELNAAADAPSKKLT